MKRLIRPLKAAIGKRLDGESKTLIKNSSWVFIASLNSAVCDFIRSIILGRGLGVENFGVYILIITLVHTIQEFFNLNLGTALIKFGAEYKSSNNIEKLVALLKASFALAGATAIISVLFIAAVNQFAYEVFISQPGLHLYIQVYAIAASLSFFDYISISFLKLYFKFRLNSLVKILLDVLELGIIGTAVYLFPGRLSKVIVAAICALLVKGLIYNGVALWELRDVILPNLGARIASLRVDWRRIQAFVINNSASRTIHTLIFSGDVLLLGALAGPVQVGYYAIAKKLAFAILRITDPLSNSIYPQLATLVAEKRYADVTVMLKKVTSLLACLIVPIFTIALVLGEWIMTFIYGNEYRPAAISFVILLAAAGISAIFFWSTSLIFSLGRVDVRLKAYLLSLLVGGTLAYLLTPVYGATGLAVSLLVAVAIQLLMFLSVSVRSLRG